jgi:hypothetical protein
MIVGKLKTVRERARRHELLNLSTRGQRVFGITKLVFVFETFDNERRPSRALRRVTSWLSKRRPAPRLGQWA